MLNGAPIQRSPFTIHHSAFASKTMADTDETKPIHEVRPTTQRERIPARFIPQPTVEPGHTFASITDHISSIVTRKKMPIGWVIGFAISSVLMLVFCTAIAK